MPATSSFGVLRADLVARAAFSESELDFIRSLFTPRALRARDYFLRAGTVPTHSAFVVHGCLRTYVIDAEGREHIIKFQPETWL